MKSRSRSLASLLAAPALILGACTSPDDVSDDAAEYSESSPEARAIVALVNDPKIDALILTGGAHISRTAATNLIAHRNGGDTLVGTADDDAYDTLAEVDAVPYVGPATLRDLLTYAQAHGYGGAAAPSLEVLFSPQPYAASHLPRVAKLIDAAKTSLDIAMYSFSDSGISASLAAAVKRGVKVRFVFETAGEDKSLTGAALLASKSGLLESSGVDVRYVNKIMHHKFMIVDGPKHDLALASSAQVVTGSANWSSSAGTKYDENTLVAKGYPQLTLRLQRDFNLLWEHSRDFALSAPLPYELSTAAIDDAAISRVDHAGIDALFTSSNFSVNGTTFSTTGANTLADGIVAAINAAKKSIHIASGHLRSRPVAEALMAKAKAAPGVEIKIYLDAQEYISAASDAWQQNELTTCLVNATTDAQQRACTDKGFLYGRVVGSSGIQVRYKYYSYRWDASYAAQMHDKYFLFDGETLLTGSYNLSDNAEHDTFENMLVFKGAEFKSLIAAYEGNFASIWDTGRGPRFDGIQTAIQTANTIPLVFDPVSLDWDQVTALKTLIRANCTVVDTDAYRSDAAGHQTCPR